MKSDPPIFRLLVINLCLIFSLTTGEIEFYQDVEQEPSDTDVRLKQLELYLESQNRPRYYRRDHTPPHRHPQPYDDDYNIIYRQRQNNILDALIENPRILDILEKNKPNYMNHQSDYGNINYPRSMDPPYDLDQPSNIYKIPKFKLPPPDHRITDNFYFENSQNYPRIKQPNRDNYEDNIESSLERLQEKLLAINEQKHYELPGELTHQSPEFTYNFDEPSNEEKHSEFAVKPNDPRYYEGERSEHVTRREEKHSEDEVKPLNYNAEGTSEGDDDKYVMPIYKPNRTSDIGSKIDSKLTGIDEMMPEPQRRAEKDPVITLTNDKGNNDVYFIAIVAGCSAAAMFALVLISLTWCRLQRGVKAAADIEYPAYGVTGPNKDVSPSGDQRLAHSAQMYHFQHQKQQIIAMEKSSASRDPGSVSEAESDEENEEGDYTVYECPGLAPAGEVEVKNPMFRDDPTPATPQNHRDEDHRH